MSQRGVGTTFGLVPNGAEYIPVGTLPNPFLGAANFWFSQDNASYNAFHIDLTKRLDKGLQFRVDYTVAKNLDTLAELAGSQSAKESQYVRVAAILPMTNLVQLAEHEMAMKLRFQAGASSANMSACKEAAEGDAGQRLVSLGFGF
jgi:hypothetical protein